jgi:uncharacterized membrane-anchored protein
MTTFTIGAPSRTRQMLNKVPEVTIWFWIIKILCTTVGESFADWINMQLGVGLDKTALIFTVVLAVVLGVQFRLDRYVPFVYWLTVVVISVTGTLYTDILTDDRGVPLKTSTTIFALLLAVVFAVWYARERTLSIHSIVTIPREAFYWLAVLVTFALGTAAGDWTLELTGWGPGKSVVLPAGLIAVITIGWRLGGNAVLCFWLAYILTRPLGANLGDWFATPGSEQGLGVGTAGTSVIFLVAIGATVTYLTVTKADVITDTPAVADHHGPTNHKRQSAILALFLVVAAGTGALLHHTSQQPHASALADEGPPAAPLPALPPGQAVQHFAAAEIAPLKKITQDTLTLLTASNQAGATKRIKDLETAWDDSAKKMEAEDKTGWTYIDGQIDTVLTELRAKKPDPATEKTALNALLTTFG